MAEQLDEILQRLKEADIVSETGKSPVAPNSIFIWFRKLDVFTSFSNEIHCLIEVDSARKSALFRVLRFCISSSTHVHQHQINPLNYLKNLVSLYEYFQVIQLPPVQS
jgi:hypothetical protein